MLLMGKTASLCASGTQNTLTNQTVRYPRVQKGGWGGGHRMGDCWQSDRIGNMKMSAHSWGSTTKKEAGEGGKEQEERSSSTLTKSSQLLWAQVGSEAPTTTAVNKMNTLGASGSIQISMIVITRLAPVSDRYKRDGVYTLVSVPPQRYFTPVNKYIADVNMLHQSTQAAFRSKKYSALLALYLFGIRSKFRGNAQP